MIAITNLGQHTLLVLELMGTAAFAISGVLSAMRKKMDVVGIVVCGFLAAFGGGTLRDVLIDRRPFFWAEHQGFCWAHCFCVWFARHSLGEVISKTAKKLLQVADAVGLGLFCSTGIHLSWTMGQPPAIAIMMGVITGTFGGVLRDMACNEIPSLFRDHSPYAICALAGALLYVGLRYADAPQWAAVSACAVGTTSLRLLTLWRNWKLPSVRSE